MSSFHVVRDCGAWYIVELANEGGHADAESAVEELRRVQRLDILSAEDALVVAKKKLDDARREGREQPRIHYLKERTIR